MQAHHSQTIENRRRKDFESIQKKKSLTYYIQGESDSNDHLLLKRKKRGQNTVEWYF